MDKRQDIGAAFKQRLQDLNQGPTDSAALWDQITTQLDAETTRPKGIPIWMKSGLAVLVVGLVSYGIWQFTAGANQTEELIELTETPATDALNSENEEDNNSPEGSGSGGQENTIIAADGDALETSTETKVTANSIAADNIVNTANTDSTENTVNTTVDRNSGSVLTTTRAKSTAIAKTQNTNAVVVNDKDEIINTEAKAGVAADPETGNTTVNSSAVGQTSTAVKANTAVNTNNTKQGQLNENAATSTGGSTTAIAGNDPNLPARGFYVLPKSSIKDSGIQNNSYPLVYDIEATEKAKALPAIEYRSGKKKKTKEMRALERALKREEALNYKWSVGAVIAPTTYGSLTKASMLDARLENNTRDGETNLSYGVQVKNQMNRNSALRFGINRVNVGYNTQNFQINIIDGVVNIYQLTGIDPGAEIEEGGIALNPQATAFFEANDVVTIDQDISYLEIPVEYQYSFINNRFGANLIGGASLMLLDDNRIFAVNDFGESVPVGKSSNLTNLGYTVNLGLGLKYDISKHFQLNLDPMLKIQMNSPENTSTNNFKPYYFGVFSGIHFKF